MYFDLDPYLPVSGGSSANGNLGGKTFGLHTMDAPFRWDMCVHWEKDGATSSKIKYFERDGSESSTQQNEASGILEDAFDNAGDGDDQTNWVEARIKWSEINGAGGGRPAAFNWFAYAYNYNLTNPSDYPPGSYDFIFQTVPNENLLVTNPKAYLNGTHKFYFYQTVPNTDPAGISDPFSNDLRSFETHGNYNYTSAQLATMYDMTVFGEVGDNYLDIEQDVTIMHDLVIDGSAANLKSNSGHHWITMAGADGMAHIGNGGTMYGEYSGNYLKMRFSDSTALQQVGSNTFDAREVTVDAGATVNAGTSCISYASGMGGGGVVNLNGTVITTNLNGFSGTDSSTFRSGYTSWTVSTTSLVQYADSSGGTQSVSPRTDYGNVEILGGGIKSFAGAAANVTVNGTLTFTSGMLYTGSNKVILNNPAVGSVTGYDATNYINGTLTRKVNSTGEYHFPVGNETLYEPAVIELVSSSGLDSITAHFTGTAVTPSGTLLSYGPEGCDEEATQVNQFLNAGYWTIESAPASPVVNYDITLTSNGHDNAAYYIENHSVFKNSGLVPADWVEAGRPYDANCDVEIPVGGSIYPVTVTNTGLSSFSNFAIGLDTLYILPVGLTAFTGWYTGDVNALQWVTHTELHADVFKVEKSTDGSDFYPIGSVDAAGNSSEVHTYSFTDAEPLPGVQYYRLQILDLDGSYEYSHVIAITAGDGTPFHIAVNPNPAADYLFVMLTDAGSGEVQLRILDITGRRIAEFPGPNGGNHTMKIDIAALARGIYLLSATDVHTGNTILTRFMK